MNFVCRQFDIVPFVPFEQFVAGLVRVKPQQTQLRSEANGAVVALARLNMAFPNRLHASAGKLDSLQIFRPAKVINERLAHNLSDLNADAPEHLGGRRILSYGDMRDET
jgi:hypothetical protein